MTRKEWLEKFLWLFDNGRPTVEYRKYLRIMGRDINKHVKLVDVYRRQLKDILEEEDRQEKEKQKITERMRKAREARLKKIMEAEREQEWERRARELEKSGLDVEKVSEEVNNEDDD